MESGVWGLDVHGRRFRIRRRVAFSDTDAAGIAHFTAFFRYFEDAEHSLWRNAGLSIHPDGSPLGWPRISASCEFQKPLRFEQEFDVSIHITDMTRRTISYEGDVTRDGDRIARGTWRVAAVTKSPDGTMRSTEIPAAVAERLKPFVIPTSDSQPPTA